MAIREYALEMSINSFRGLPVKSEVIIARAELFLSFLENKQENAAVGECHEHNPVQHRDTLEPWCNSCGTNKDMCEPRRSMQSRESHHKDAVESEADEPDYLTYEQARRVKQEKFLIGPEGFGLNPVQRPFGNTPSHMGDNDITDIAEN